MFKILPGWYSTERERLKQNVYDIARRQNMNFKFVLDSKNLNDCIDSIMTTMLRIKEESIPDVSDKELAQWENLEKAEKQQEKK